MRAVKGSPARREAKAESRKRGRPAVRLVGNAPEAPPAAANVTNGKEAGTGARPRRGDGVRERILKAALECFGTFGFEGTSTRAVAQRAEVTHTLVLYHYQSKDSLWIATMEDALNKYMAETKENFDKSAAVPAAAALRIFIEQFVRMSARQPQIHRILTMESNQGTPRLQFVIDHFLRAHFTRVRELIRRGQSEGSVRQCDPARLYYHIVSAGGTPFTISTEYMALTGRNVFSEAEILRNIAFIYEIVFI